MYTTQQKYSAVLADLRATYPQDQDTTTLACRAVAAHLDTTKPTWTQLLRAARRALAGR